MGAGGAGCALKVLGVLRVLKVQWVLGALLSVCQAARGKVTRRGWMDGICLSGATENNGDYGVQGSGKAEGNRQRCR